MAYKLLNNAELKAWNATYKEYSDALASEANEVERAKLTAKMQSLGTQVEEHLNEVGRKLRTYFTQHITKVNNWERLSQQAITAARKAAADYKKDTTAGLPPQLQQAVENLRLWEAAMGDDGTALGAAWFGYRADGDMNKIPLKYRAAFQAVRNKLMDEQKVVSTTRARVKAYQAEAEALLKVAAKATMKAGIKAGTGAQRPIAEAQQDARDLAEQMAAELEKVRNPPGTATAPSTIRTTKQAIRDNAADKGYTRLSGNVTLLNSRKNLLKSGLKLMRTRVAGMGKVLAVRTKSFRSNELADATVKAQLKNAQKFLKDAQTELKTSEADATKGLAYAATIEARWKAKK